VASGADGHLVLSTLHTNDALWGDHPPMDLNIIPFLISSTLLGVVAQRLVRKICVECKHEVDLTEAQAAALQFACRRARNSNLRGQGLSGLPADRLPPAAWESLSNGM